MVGREKESQSNGHLMSFALSISDSFCSLAWFYDYRIDHKFTFQHLVPARGMVHVVRKTASNSGFTSNKFMFVAYFYLPCVLNGHAQQNGRKMRQDQARRSDGTFFFHSTCFIAHPAAIKCRLVATLAMNVGPSTNELVYATQTLCPTDTHTDTHRHTIMIVLRPKNLCNFLLSFWSRGFPFNGPNAPNN